LSRLSIGLRIVEAMAVLMPRPEANERAFVVLLNVLRLLDAAVSHWTNILPFFQLQISALLGFSPSLDRDQIEAIVEEGGFLRLSDGALFSFKPDQAALPISRRAARAIGILVHARIEHILRMDLDPSTASEVEDTVESYLRYHVEDFRPSRSKLVFEQIERS